MTSDDEQPHPAEEEAAEIAGDAPDDQAGDPAGDDEQADPLDVFVDANTEFQEALDELDEDEPGFAARQMQLVDDFLQSFKSVDPPNHVRDQIAAVVSDNTDVSKKSARRELQKYVKKHERETRSRPELSAIVRGELQRVEALAANETDSEVRYRFVLDGGDTVVVGEDGLWSATAVRRALASHYRRVPVFDPPEGVEWEDLVDEIYDELLVVKRDAVGPRMQVIERVRELVQKHAAHTDIVDAYHDSGVYVEDAEADTVFVESSRIEERAKEHDETLAGVRWEMDDKGLRVGQSERKRCGDGKVKNWWPLDRGEFTPKRVEQPDADAEADGEDGGGTDE
jgi:hypothetical protein